jgi:hypothetical protein
MVLVNRCRLAGLPEPVTQLAIVPGRRYRWDAAWPLFKVGVEVQGGGERGAHSRFVRYAADQEKAALVQLMGWVSIAATPAQIKSGQAVEWIAAALALRGWTGQVTCPPLATAQLKTTGHGRRPLDNPAPRGSP